MGLSAYEQQAYHVFGFRIIFKTDVFYVLKLAQEDEMSLTKNYKSIYSFFESSSS